MSEIDPQSRELVPHEQNVPAPPPDDRFSKHYFMDLLEGMGGNDADKSEHGAHARSNRNARGGGSNFAFADGSVRYLKYGTAVSPENQWCLEQPDRANFAFTPP